MAIAFLSRWIAEAAYRNIISFLVIFGLIFIVIGVLGILIKYLLNIASLGWLDRFCGLAFGGIKGVLIAAVLLLTLTAFLPRGTALIKQSLLAPHVTVIAESLAGDIHWQKGLRCQDCHGGDVHGMLAVTNHD